jgi:hypothetical protein
MQRSRQNPEIDNSAFSNALRQGALRIDPIDAVGMRVRACIHVLYCTVLYCTVLCYTVLYCTVLYCAILCYTVLYCTVLYCAILYCAILYCTVHPRLMPPKLKPYYIRSGTCLVCAKAVRIRCGSRNLFFRWTRPAARYCCCCCRLTS